MMFLVCFAKLTIADLESKTFSYSDDCIFCKYSTKLIKIYMAINRFYGERGNVSEHYKYHFSNYSFEI